MRTIRINPQRTPFETKLYDEGSGEQLMDVYRLEVVFEAGAPSATGKMFTYHGTEPSAEPEEVFVWFDQEEEVSVASE